MLEESPETSESTTQSNNNIQEENTTSTQESSFKIRWDEIIVNRKRFRLLTIIFTLIELILLCIITFAFISEENPRGYHPLGLFLIPPFVGAAIAYFVDNAKEAMVIGTINATAAIIPFDVGYIIYDLLFTTGQPTSREVFFEYIGLPILMILIQIAVAITVARTKTTLRQYESSGQKARDEALIEELKESRRRRGLEPYPEEEAVEEGHQEIEEIDTQDQESDKTMEQQ
ncbi:MAG: hypothetical protein GF308_05670 [Candidatus Heimdallarchaeota archaeon]|nr:hypothetical protein [Candidatus Heimdallarchaeota archaeon]